MCKKIILLLLIATISSKINEVSTNIEFDVDVPLAENNQFTFSNEDQEAQFYFVDIDSKKNFFQYKFQCPGAEEKSGMTDMIFLIIKAETGECSITVDFFGWDSESVATIYIHPFKNKIPVTLNKDTTYQTKKYVGFKEKFPSLTFSVSNLEKDTGAEFNYKGSSIPIDGKEYQLKNNPFRICQGSDCKDDITKYRFSKGKEYTIEIKPEEIDTGTNKYYYIDEFSFYGKEVDPDPTDPEPTDPSPTDPSPTDPSPTDPTPTDPTPTDPTPTDPTPTDPTPTADPIPTDLGENYILMNPLVYLLLILLFN